MKTIEIDGTIGLDVSPSMISEQLKKANGEDVEILFSSPGGYIDEGLAMFNLIHDYPGKTTAIIIGMAASMASYIPLAADKVIAKSNAVYMIHDALAGLYGNESEHEKIAKILGGFSNLLADIYVKKTGKTKDEIRAMMKEESYFFGSEILDAGFVDAIDDIDVSKKEDKDDTILEAMAKVELTASRVKDKNENLTKIAAILKNESSSFQPRKEQSKPALHIVKKSQSEIQTQTEEKMNNFEKLVEDYQHHWKCSRTTAIREMAKKQPEAHQQYIIDYNNGLAEKQASRRNTAVVSGQGFQSLLQDYRAKNPGLSKSASMKAVIRANPEAHADYIRQVNA